MLPFLRKIVGQSFVSLNKVIIHHDRLLSNLDILKEVSWGSDIFPVLKSNAYGHWIEQVAIALRNTDVPYICVDSIPEYQIIKKKAKKPSLLIWETLPENYKFLDPKWVTVCIYNIATLASLIKTRKSWKIHLFLNTWMNREWIQMHELWWFLDLLKDSNIQLEWVMSHFANADEVDSSFCYNQIEKFKEMNWLIEQYWFSTKYRHISNSAWIAKIHDPYFNAWRSWIWFYWYSPLSLNDEFFDKYTNLKPSLTVESTIVSLQRIKKWDIVSYWWKFTADKDMTVATIPFWYTEWLDRKLINMWKVSYKDDYLPILGTICMNLSIIDTKWHDVKIWDTVEVISPDIGKDNSISGFATWISSIPYEVLVNIDPKAKRELL